MKRRVVITGLGAITPLGTGVDKSWQALLEGRSGIAEVTRFDASAFRNRIAGEVKDFAPEDFLGRKLARTTDRFIQFALAATQMAMEDSKLQVTPDNSGRVGVVVGTGLGGLPALEESHRLILEGKPRKLSPFFLPSFLANMAPGQVAIQFGAKGPNLCPVTACAAGTHSIGDAFKIIQRGDADAMIAGGTEACVTPLTIGGFDALRATSTRNDEPQRASRPFDKQRDGFVPAEGAGIVILEELPSALQRGAKIYAEIIGYGLNDDAYHITAPSPNGEGAAQCIQKALLDAGIAPEEVDYVNAHGTSTPINDLSETMAIKSVFKEHSKKLCVSSNKSMTGHLFGAAGAVEAVFCTLTIRDGIIPPTINYETPDPGCDLDYVPNKARRAEVRIAISDSFGFGGTNATIVLREFIP
jgi:3-oxoacyl-[acyl-carrier-protein] synthase II